MYEELVKRLRDRAAWINFPHHGEEFPTEDAKLMMDAADAIEELSKPRWIPVTERLPQDREWVLCQCRAKIRIVLRLQNGYWHQDSRHEFMSGFVTHWMPLPTPPKEET